MYKAQSPCFLSPLANSLLLPLLVPFTYLETLLAFSTLSQSLPSPNSQYPGYQAPHYDDLKNPASPVRKTNIVNGSFIRC